MGTKRELKGNAKVTKLARRCQGNAAQACLERKSACRERMLGAQECSPAGVLSAQAYVARRKSWRGNMLRARECLERKDAWAQECSEHTTAQSAGMFKARETLESRSAWSAGMPRAQKFLEHRNSGRSLPRPQDDFNKSQLRFATQDIVEKASEHAVEAALRPPCPSFRPVAAAAKRN